MKLKNLFLILSLSTILFSCSKDEDGQGVIQFDKNAKLNISKIEATTIDASIEAESLANINIGIRKLGETVFENLIQNTLSPAQQYEVTILVEGSDDLLFPVKEVVTPPFDYLFDLNSERSIEYLYSEKGFEHTAYTGYNFEGDINFNEKRTYRLFLVDTEDEENRIPLEYTFVEGKLTFKVPETTVSDLPYELYHSYYLGYQVNDSNVEYIEAYNEGKNLIFAILNPTPNISKLSFTERNACGNSGGYTLLFTGHFMNNFDVNSPYYLENSTVVITRVDTGKQLLIEESENASCLSYTRSWSSSSFTYVSNLMNIHKASQIKIKYPETNTNEVLFTRGDYTIKATFSNAQGDFYETNEFAFRIDDLREITNTDWNLYKYTLNERDVTSERLNECDLEQKISFDVNGTFVDSYFKNDGSTGCIFDESFAGTWTEEENPGDDRKFVLLFDYNIGATDPDDPAIFYLSGNDLIEVYEESDLNGGINTYKYYYKRVPK